MIDVKKLREIPYNTVQFGREKVIKYLKLLMTNYNEHSGIKKREPFVEKIFQVLQEYRNGTYNEEGSFTPSGADEAIKNEVNIDDQARRLVVSPKGRMALLEDGKTDWGWLKRVWFKSLRKTVLIEGDKDKVKEMDEIISGLPETTTARPYVKFAMEGMAPEVADHVDDLIKEAIK